MATARKRISELTALTSASLDTVVVGVDNGITYKIELDTLADAVTSRVNILDRDRLQSLESAIPSFETKGRNIVSSSAQVSNLGFVLSSDTASFVRESQTGSFLTSIPNGIISSSAQVSNLGFVSNSVDITHLNSFTESQNTLNVAFTNGIMARLQTSSFNEFSSSVNQRIINATNEQNLSNLATTGSNTFIGNQKITGSVSILIPGGTATGMNENPTPNNVFWSYPSQDTNTANVATGWTAQVVGGGTYTVTNVQVDTPFAPFIAITLSDPSLTLSYRSRINFSKTSKLWEFNSNGTLTGLPDGLVSGSSQISTFGFISSSQTINTASFATTGSNTFTGTTTFSGSVIIGPIGGDEGGEISLALAQTGTTLTGSAVVLDVYQDRLRIFENSGSFRGAHIDMTKLPSGVAGELIWKTSGFVNAGTFLTLDNLKVSVTTGGSRGLSVGAVSTNFTANISGWFGYTGGGGGASAVNIGYTTTGSSSAFGWSFGTEGDGSNYIINDKTNNRVYRVTLMIGNGYNNNFISIERLY